MDSLGFIRSMSPRWLVEGWASFPSEESAETSWILKLDFVIPLAGSDEGESKDVD